MVDKTLAYLDYIKLLHYIKKYLSTPFAQDLMETLRPVEEQNEIIKRQDALEAVMEVVKWEGKIPLACDDDPRDIFKRLSIPEYSLEAKEAVEIANFLRVCGEIHRFLKKAPLKLDFIEEITESIHPLSPVYARITKTINPEGFIEDTASYELSRIRADLFLYKERVKRHLEKIMEREMVRSIMQDDFISLRNSRYVIPMKPNFNQAIQGIVHDYSHSLKTSFVEPVEVVEQNNTINILEKEEKEEEKRILRELSLYLRSNLNELDRNLESLKILDLYHALALFSIEYNCIRPEIGDDFSLEVRGAMNPFIVISKGELTVPINIAMAEEKRAMIISGPNAGGKTAALKTIGLLAAMALTGLFVPAREMPRIPFYRKIFAVIGDEQDIAMELSSFTAHILAIRELYGQAVGGELVLVDEIGGATEPQEASALAMSIIDSFVSRGCRIAVTTHLNLLKAYGYVNDFAMNVATTFDTESLKPLYTLIYGTAGYSNAITVAKNMEMPEEIIEKSYEYLGKQEFMLNELITTLEKEKMLLEHELDEVARIKEEARKRLESIREKRDEYLKKTEEKCRADIESLEEELEEVKKEIAKKEKGAIRIAKSKLDAFKKRYTPVHPKVEEKIQVGDQVFVKTLDGSGYIGTVDYEKDLYEVVIGNIRTKVNRRHIEKRPLSVGRSAPSKNTVHIESLKETELKLIGKRVDEALDELDRFVDKAIVDGITRIRIVHGIGSGRLMDAIRQHLSAQGCVKDFRPDEKNVGATIVELL